MPWGLISIIIVSVALTLVITFLGVYCVRRYGAGYTYDRPHPDAQADLVYLDSHQRVRPVRQYMHAVSAAGPLYFK